MMLIKKIFRLIDRSFGNYLRGRYSSLTVIRPYIINVSNTKELTGKIVIITGGSGVIGRAIAIRLAVEGAKVYVCGTQQEKVDNVVAEIKKLGYEAIGVIFNILSSIEISNTF